MLGSEEGSPHFTGVLAPVARGSKPTMSKRSRNRAVNRSGITFTT